MVQIVLTCLHYFVAMANMNLGDYLTYKKINASKAARELHVSHTAVGHWVSGKRLPRPEQMLFIYRWSRGQVQPNDFYDLPNLNSVDELPLFANGHASAGLVQS